MLNFDEAKLLIEKPVKIAIPDFTSNVFIVGSVMCATLVKINYNAEITDKGETVLNFTANVDVSDIGGGVHHILVDKIYDTKIEDTTIKQIDLSERIAKLTVELDALNAELNKEKG